jgi:hypothetical protein
VLTTPVGAAEEVGESVDGEKDGTSEADGADDMVGEAVGSKVPSGTT